MSAHPNEPTLVFRSSLGLWIPTREWREYETAAEGLGPAYVHALAVQGRRQSRPTEQAS